jgi:hypothetical protein
MDPVVLYDFHNSLLMSKNVLSTSLIFVNNSHSPATTVRLTEYTIREKQYFLFMFRVVHDCPLTMKPGAVLSISNDLG